MLDEHKLFDLVGLLKKSLHYLIYVITLSISSVTNMQKIRNQEEGTFYSTVANDRGKKKT